MPPLALSRLPCEIVSVQIQRQIMKIRATQYLAYTLLLAPWLAYAADPGGVAGSDTFLPWLAGIAAVLAAAGIAAAIKSWGDVRVLQSQVVRLSGAVDKMAELAYVKESLDRIEKRLESLPCTQPGGGCVRHS